MVQLGCIADDFTGATDLGSMLVRAGFNTVQWLGIPERILPDEDVDAILISLKTRSIPSDQAVDQSLQALDALKKAGCQRFLFKYCSTFDSTDKGNIGPVAEALLDALGSHQTIFCPAFPENHRTVCYGNLFVNGKPLNESGMENHPVNPMTDANLVRVLGRQTINNVGLIEHSTVKHGPAKISNSLKQLQDQGIRLVIADAINDSDLASWAEAVVDFPLITGGSAIANQLAKVLLVRNGKQSGFNPELPRVEGRSVVLAGSCSRATLRQVDRFKELRPTFILDPHELSENLNEVLRRALDFAAKHLINGPVLFASTATPDAVKKSNIEVGEHAARLVESAFSELAKGLVEQGVRRMIIAGGETSGAVLQSLGVSGLKIGPEIDPGVPWTKSMSEPKMALALKSGNFGGDDFFSRALDMLP